jgi:hypothetical protein
MRTLHQHALTEAESKKTELRLVLASRYRELVGSSDEVSTMSRDASVLQDLVCQLPSLVDALIKCVNKDGKTSESETKIQQEEEKSKGNESGSKPNTSAMIISDRIKLSSSTRVVHSYLDENDVHGATTSLLDAFQVISKYTNQYPLVNQLINNSGLASNKSSGGDSAVLVPPTSLSPNDAKILYTQIKMIYLHLQTIPLHTIQLSKKILVETKNKAAMTNVANDAHDTARALSALHRLNVSFFQYSDATRSNKLLDLYFDSKAKLIHSLLDKLSGNGGGSSGSNFNEDGNKTTLMMDDNEDVTDVAEHVISKIVLILQHDIILYPYQIFMMRKYALKQQHQKQYQQKEENLVEDVMNTLPSFDHEQVKTKASNFLAAHLPLIRSKVKTVLVGIAGTTASRLGSIRQSLYDKTDGAACITSLSSDGLCTWDEAVQNIVDLKIITRALDGLSSSSAPTDSTTATSIGRGSSATTTFTNTSSQRKFSLWSTLFSNTFSSLVHSILSTSFHSVHRQVVATLRASLANAPSFSNILPHEAYRNTLRIASELDAALKKVSDDAHELLVHAEEREESERRLKQSLYVQTCEIMGRLLNELRRMLLPTSTDSNGNEAADDEDATKELIVGRLCYLLKFRLTYLPKLLDPNSSPAVLASRSGRKIGMITVAELESAFEIADVDDDGLINFEEAMEAMDGAFSGTQFHGAEMVRDTMLLGSGSDDKTSSNVSARATPRNLTLSELALLSARGLRHDVSGSRSSLGTIQRTLDDIVESCFSRWATAALSPYTKSCMSSMAQLMTVSSTTTDEEWKRLHKYSNSTEGDLLQEEIDNVLEEGDVTPTAQVGNVSSFIVSYLISVSALLNKGISPSDSLPPFPSSEYAAAMGIDVTRKDVTMVDTLRSCLLKESLISITNVVDTHILESEMHHDHNENELMLKTCGPSALTQLLLDVKFILDCFFERNKYGWTRNIDASTELEELSSDYVRKSKEVLRNAESKVIEMAKETSHATDIDDCISVFDSRYAAVYGSCSMFLSSLLGDDDASSLSNKENIGGRTEQHGNRSLLINPLPSSRRFTLLPIQAEQSVKELQLIRNLEKERAEKSEAEKRSGASAAANAVSSGIGYFSSFLKKK